MLLRIHVNLNSKKFELFEKNGRLIANVKSKPEENKANIELITELSKLLERNVKLIRGAKERNKILEIEGEEKEILQLLAGKIMPK